MEKKNNYRIIFMGTPSIAAHVLEALINHGFNIIALIAQEDKKVGRKAQVEEVPTKIVAKQYGIEVFQPHRIRKDYEFVKSFNPDLILTMAYGQIIPQELLDIPRFGCLNLHGSLLPSLRGAAPIQRAIINGDKITGITLMEMVDKMDAGKMYAFEKVDILDEDNYSSLANKLSEAAIKICLDNLPLYFEGKLVGEEQDENLVTFADKISDEDEKLNINLSTKEFINYVRGLADEPGGYLCIDTKKIKIFKAHHISDEVTSLVGTLIINKNVYLQLKDGIIALDYVQLEGKKRMDGKSFANGNKSFNGIILH